MDSRPALASSQIITLEKMLSEREDEIARLRAENEALKEDAGRLDWLDKNVTMVSDSERYLPRRVYWGKGTNKNARQAIDAARGEK
jgi:hypothetical protein